MSKGNEGPNKVDVLGVQVASLTREEAMTRLCHMARDGGSHHVVTVNPEFVMMAQHDPAFRRVLNAADLAIPDGAGIVWAARLLHGCHCERITGVDSVLSLACYAADADLRPFLLGAAPGVGEQTAEVLRRRYPGLQIAGVYAGSPTPEEEDAIVTRILDARPDLLFVAYGAPQQDLWIARTRQRLQVPLAMGVGGSFDFISGRRRRAPLWMQRWGLEWLNRLYHEPWRWRRMLALPRFALAVLAVRVFDPSVARRRL